MATKTTDLVLLDGSHALDRDVVGGKAWAIDHMRSLGLPVPPAVALGTDVCRRTLAEGALPTASVDALRAGIDYLEREVGRTLGGDERPLLVSVRSGAARSMPGMMDTVLNVGATPAALRALAQEGGAELARDIEHRFGAQFAKVVGPAAPDDAFAQVCAAATAVFRSWNSARARTYRDRHDLGGDGGTAVIVQAMVFGNLDATSGTGVLFSRNPLTGSATPMGEWLPRAQGEDVVSGRVSPLPLSALAEAHPGPYAELMAAARLLESDARDVQDIEFTVESGRLWLLQTRNAKRSPEAAVRLALALAREGLISGDEALARIRPEDVSVLRRPRVNPVAAAAARVLARGEPGCPGVGTGLVVGTADEAVELAEAGTDVVLATATTEPDDVHGMVASRAVVTELGGSTSHAAVVSRELGLPAVVGCGAGALRDLVGSMVTVDGGAGLVYAGIVAADDPVAVDDPDLVDLARRLGTHDIGQVLPLLRARAA